MDAESTTHVKVKLEPSLKSSLDLIRPLECYAIDDEYEDEYEGTPSSTSTSENEDEDDRFDSDIDDDGGGGDVLMDNDIDNCYNAYEYGDDDDDDDDDVDDLSRYGISPRLESIALDERRRDLLEESPPRPEAPFARPESRLGRPVVKQRMRKGPSSNLLQLENDLLREQNKKLQVELEQARLTVNTLRQVISGNQVALGRAREENQLALAKVQLLEACVLSRHAKDGSLILRSKSGAAEAPAAIDGEKKKPTTTSATRADNFKVMRRASEPARRKRPSVLERELDPDVVLQVEQPPTESKEIESQPNANSSSSSTRELGLYLDSDIASEVDAASNAFVPIKLNARPNKLQKRPPSHILARRPKPQRRWSIDFGPRTNLGPDGLPVVEVEDEQQQQHQQQSSTGTSTSTSTSTSTATSPTMSTLSGTTLQDAKSLGGIRRLLFGGCHPDKYVYSPPSTPSSDRSSDDMSSDTSGSEDLSLPLPSSRPQQPRKRLVRRLLPKIPILKSRH